VAKFLVWDKQDSKGNDRYFGDTCIPL